MAYEKSVFLVSSDKNKLYEEIDISIRWLYNLKNVTNEMAVNAVHKGVHKEGVEGDVLEISTASSKEVGKRLSAFSLKYPLNGKLISLESVYQGSKLFKDDDKTIGPFTELFEKTPAEAKKFVKQYNNFAGFKLDGKSYATEPKSAFYDFLYINCIAPHEKWIMENVKENAFSDIFYSKKSSFACQARTFAMFKALSKRKLLQKCAADFDFFVETLKKYNY